MKEKKHGETDFWPFIGITNSSRPQSQKQLQFPSAVYVPFYNAPVLEYGGGRCDVIVLAGLHSAIQSHIHKSATDR